MLAPKIKGTLEGGEQSVKKMTTFANKLHADLRTTIAKMGFDVETLAKQNVQRLFSKNPHGNLLGAINTRMEETSTSILASVGISSKTIPGARIHEFGGVILPKKGNFLSWVNMDGEHIFARRVVMPERSYLRTALGTYAPNVEKRIRASIRRAAKESGIHVA